MRLTPPGHRRDDPTVVLPQASAFAPPRPAVTGGDPDETTRISQPTTTDPDETTRISRPADGPDGGDETTTVLPARPDDAGKSPS